VAEQTFTRQNCNTLFYLAIKNS